MKRWQTIAYLAIAAVVVLGFFYLGITRKLTTGQDAAFGIFVVWMFLVIGMKIGLLKIPPLYDMSREFWHTLGFVALISSIVVPIAGRYLNFGDFFVFSTFLGCFVGAICMLQLGNASDSEKDRSE